MTQTSFDQFASQEEDTNCTDVPIYYQQAREAREKYPVGPDGRVCPWCLAGSTAFHKAPGNEDNIACGNCSAIIPTGAEWYKRGDVIL